MLTLGAVWNAGPWILSEGQPKGDLLGYAAQLRWVSDSLLAHGRIPDWCVECYGGASVFTPQWKEILAFPLTLATDPITAMKLAWLALRIVSGLGIYLCAARLLGAPGAGIVAGYAYAFGAMSNAQNAHLDMALAAALLPFLWFSLVEVFRRNTWGFAVAAGALTAVLFANNWVYAFVAPFAAAVLIALRPWPGRRLAAGWGWRSGLAATVFCSLAASTLAWLIFDSPNHRLVDPESAALQRLIYLERSPFLYFNRAGFLDSWLATHHPPGHAVSGWDGDWRYLGFSVLLVCAAGFWTAARRSLERLGMAALFGLFLFQYGLALGPRTLLWEVCKSFGWSDTTETALRYGLWSVAALAGAAACTGRLRKRLGAGALFWIALFGFFPTVSLWSAFSALPPFSVQRSPGHFFDTAQVWLCLAFAAGLAAWLQKLAPMRNRNALLCVVAVAVGLDFASSRHAFSSSASQRPLEAAAHLVASLDGEQGTLRAVLPPGYGPAASWVMSHSEVGFASGWLGWQGGRHWQTALEAAAYRRASEHPESRDGVHRLDPDSARLAELRVRYFLLPRQRFRLSAPWRRAGSRGPFTLWEQPSVQPLARGLRDLSGETAFAVESSRPRPEHLELDFHAGDAPGWVLISESHHPWWLAELDGEAVSVERASETLMAIPVVAGSQRAELRFVPPLPVRLAGWITQAAWLGLVGWIGVRGWGRLRRGL